MSYIGVQARRCVSIRHNDWRQVPQSEKDHFWEETMARWDVPNTQVEIKIWLKQAGIHWRAFKTYLANNYIHVELPTDPLLKYKWIVASDWEEFFWIRTSPDFVAKREKGKEIWSKNI